jgi:predicted 3-demethylubiquinone-9 3-methyltransferase (glyoxalase superfamily)
MQKITPFLWFNNQAEDAANYYVSVFKNSKVGKTVRYDAAAAQAAGMPEGSVLTIEFDLEGQHFAALNGGPIFTFSEAISFVVDCMDQEEVDYFWEKLSADPNGGQCGWTKDKFGVSWQIIPSQLPKLLSDPDSGRAGRAMQAMLKMKKIIIADIERAADGK